MSIYRKWRAARKTVMIGRTIRSVFKRSFPLFIVGATVLLWPLVVAGSEGPKKILIFNSEDPYLPVVELANQSIRSTISSASPMRVQFYYESLEDSRIANEKYEEDLIRLLLRKYEGERFDLLYALGTPAIRFLSKHKGTLFPGAGVVYLVVDQSRLEGLNLGPNVTGVSGKYELKPTLDIALTLQPETREVFVVAGSAPLDQIRLEQAKEEFYSYEGRVDITYLTGRSIQGFQQALAALPPRSIVLYLGMLADSAGNSFPGTEAVALLKSMANAPIYGATQSHFGTGVVGGNLVDYETLGTRAGEVGLRVLAGERPQDIPQQIVPSVKMFDARELRRLGIAEDRLPPGSVLRFKELSLWEQHKWSIIGVVLLCILEALLIVGLLINRSRRRRAEEEKDKLVAIVESSDDAILSTTVEGTITSWNAGAEKMYGYSASEMVGRHITTLVPADLKKEVSGILEQIQRGEGVDHRETVRVAKDGRYIDVSLTVSPIRDERGKIIAASTIARNITARKKAQAEAIKQRAELAHLSRVTMLSELSSSLAHELSQPLGAILRNTEAAELFLQDPSPDLEELRAILADIRQDDERAGALIDRMRSMLKRRGVEHSLLDLNVLAGEVMSLVKPDADSRRVRLALEHTSSLATVRGDRVQLQQVLLNLLLNAMDAVNDSAPDRRRISVRVQPAGTRVEVAVSDAGHGIPTDKIDHLFEPFFTTKPNGMGMGLSISRTIMDAHGGSIRAENYPEGGAMFCLTLPVTKEESAS